MTKKYFLKQCDHALRSGNGIKVFVKLPGNERLEEIYNHPVDVENKIAYYDKVYDENMKHNHAEVEIVDMRIIYE